MKRLNQSTDTVAGALSLRSGNSNNRTGSMCGAYVLWRKGLGTPLAFVSADGDVAPYQDAAGTQDAHSRAALAEHCLMFPSTAALESIYATPCAKIGGVDHAVKAKDALTLAELRVAVGIAAKSDRRRGNAARTQNLRPAARFGLGNAAAAKVDWAVHAAQARQMRAERHTWVAIGLRLGVSGDAVRKALSVPPPARG